MNKITLPQASVLTSPNPVTLICTKRDDGKTNLATVSWYTYLSFNPGMLCYAMAKTSFSGEMMREKHKAILTIPGEKLEETLMKCGMTTGRKIDKVSEFNVKMASLPEQDILVPEETKVAIILQLADVKEVGDHYLYICHVEAVYATEDKQVLFAFNGYSKIDTVD